jgi:predicted dehydrogenase
MKKNRRNFIKKAVMSSLALSSFSFANSLSAKSYRKIIGSNERINIAFQGLGRRIPGLLNACINTKNVEIMYFCDVMDKQIEKTQNNYFKRTGKKAKVEKDIHKIFEDNDVDAIVMATPDHWHAYGACKAMEYGKNVYLEKPCSHNMFENEILVNYQNYYDKNVQMGNQQRSSVHTIDLISQLRDGLIGETYKAVSYYHNNRPRVPNQKIALVPKGLDWNLFQGPAKRRDYTYNTWDYNWRWYGWLYGTGEAGNNATHELDIARWALGVQFPSSVSVYAGKYHYIDDGWTMYDTMEAKFKFPGGKTITWDGQSRNAFEKDKEGGRGTKIWGSKGSVLVDRRGYKVFDLSGNQIYNSQEDEKYNVIERNMTELHFDNFFNSIRLGEKLNSPIDDAAVSQSMVHYANISYRINKGFEINSNDGKIRDRNAKKIWSREYEKGWEINNVS